MRSTFVYAHEIDFAFVACRTLTIVPLTAPVIPAATPSADGATNKVEIEDLMKLPDFTNDTGMVLIKIFDSQWAGVYEVTQEEYQKDTGSNPSAFAGARNPVESAGWTEEGMEFCAKLAEAEQKKKMLPEGFAYTLPTQAQWEGFAASAELKDAVTS